MPTVPNILLIQAESLDGRALGCLGEPGAHTPAIDAIAERGAIFTQAYCNSPQCCPSRSSMWAGRYVWEIGAWNNYRGLPVNQRTFVHDLESAGYQTAIVGRTDHRSGAHSLKARLSAWVRSAPDPLFINKGPAYHLRELGRRQRAADWDQLDAARSWLRTERDPERPFFLTLGLMNTHPGGGYNTSPEWLDLIDPDQVRLPPRLTEAHPVMRRMLATKGCDRTFDDDFIHACRRHYLAMIAEVDGIVGELMKTLSACGLQDDTVVIFTGDHGDMRLEHGQYLKNALYEGSARIPMLMAGPGIEPGLRVDRPVALVDLYPTFMDVAETTGPEELSGYSLVQLAAGETSSHPGVVLSEYHSNFQQTGSFMLRAGDMKYIAHVGFEPQLFDLADDPEESRNLAPAQPERVRTFDRLLRDLVDYERVDAAAKATDYAEFAAWRLAFPGEMYLDAMGRIVDNWDDDIASRFAAWVEETSPL